MTKITSRGELDSAAVAEENNSTNTDVDVELDQLLGEARNLLNSAPGASGTLGAPSNTNDLALVPGIDSFLGHGYDIFGEFASAKAVKAKIYNLADEEMIKQTTVDQSMSLTPEQISHMFTQPPKELTLDYKRPKRVGYTGLFEANYDTQEIDVSQGHNSNWGIDAGVDGHFAGFTAEVKGSFDTKLTCFSSTKCIQLVAIMVYWKLDVGNYSLTNPPPIDKDVKSDFENEAVDKLMKKYGTHCLEEFGMGTKIVHSYTIDTSKFSKEINAKAEVKALYSAGSGGAGGGGHINTNFNDKAWLDKSAVSVKINAYGVSDIQIGAVPDLSKGLGEHPLAVLAQGWHNPSLITLYKDSLKPLWEVKGLMSEKKGKEFKAAFDLRAKNEQSSLAGIFTSLRPLYLFSKMVDGHNRYRLKTQAYHKDATGEWTLENDGNPWFYISAECEPNMVELHELALNDDLSIVRYETNIYIDNLNQVVDGLRIEGYSWRKTGQCLGYVYPPPANDSKEPSNAHPVFMFCDKGFQPSRGIYYNKSRDLVLDNGMLVLSSDAELALNSPFGYNRRLKDAQDWWERQDFWYKFLNGKPTSVDPRVTIGYEGSHVVSLAESVLPHWFALKLP